MVSADQLFWYVLGHSCIREGSSYWGMDRRWERIFRLYLQWQ